MEHALCAQSESTRATTRLSLASRDNADTGADWRGADKQQELYRLVLPHCKRLPAARKRPNSAALLVVVFPM